MLSCLYLNNNDIYLEYTYPCISVYEGGYTIPVADSFSVTSALIQHNHCPHVVYTATILGESALSGAINCQNKACILKTSATMICDDVPAEPSTSHKILPFTQFQSQWVVPTSGIVFRHFSKERLAGLITSWSQHMANRS